MKLKEDKEIYTSEIIREVSDNLFIKEQDIKRISIEIIAIIKKHLLNNKSVNIVSFGSFIPEKKSEKSVPEIHFRTFKRWPYDGKKIE